MNTLTRIMAHLQISLGVLCLVIFLLATLVQVSTRYLGISVLWTEEIAVNAFIWAMFLGASVMVKEKQHFGFNAISNKLTGIKGCYLSLFQNLCMLTFCVFCAIYSIEITQVFWNSRWISIPEFKQGYVWLIMPITFISSGVYLIQQILEELQPFFKGKSWNSQ
ncbi:TRAP transporter small permease [Marinomonas sp. THO17]|uniref:TRAP transporter small permease n=1 Tax=Marinomonas sp. THO17 TaxID=3149048 RepID=UPI00336BD229